MRSSPDQLALFERGSIQVGPVPETAWSPPRELPDLRGKVRRLALDLECRDDGLAQSKGPAWPWGGGYVAGAAIAWREDSVARKIYAPCAHPDTDCFDTKKLGEWLRDHVAAGVEVVTHHGAYDWGWAWREWGVEMPAAIRDTEAQAMLVDENRFAYDLDSLCKWRGLQGKSEKTLRAAASGYGLDAKSEMWRLPARYVGEYAEDDAVQTLLLCESLDQEISRQELEPALRLELDLMPMVLAMRRRGIRIDEDRVARARKKLAGERDALVMRVARELGRPTSPEDLRSPKSLEKIFEQQGIVVTERTPTGKPSFAGAWMKASQHWLPPMVARVQQLDAMVGKFLDTYLTGFLRAGRVHASINQYRGEEGGTRSYRFSYADPPLQQAPARDEEMAEVFRGAFLPEEGELWCAADQSQQEFRLIVHFAYLANQRDSWHCKRADVAARMYREDPDTDFHQLVMDWTGLERKPAKNCNFAKAFGAGVDKFALMIGRNVEEASKILAKYDEQLPFVWQLSNLCKKRARASGHIKLIDGARAHFESWVPEVRPEGEAFAYARTRQEAETRWPDQPLRLLDDRKAMNRLIQGSAARQTKLWMRDCWRESILPLIQMHDELGCSVSSPEQVRKIRELGRDAVRLSIPVKVDAEVGLDWADARHDPETYDWR